MVRNMQENSLGFIKLHRAINGWGWASSPNTFNLFIHFLLNANYKESEFRGVKIPVGSLVFGINSWSVKTGLTCQNIRTALKNLKNSGEVTHQPHRDFSIISITNWEKYQVANSQLTSGQHLPNICLTTLKEVKKERSKEERKENMSFLDSSYFNAAWELYPEKSGKKQAERYFKSSVKTEEDFESLKIAIKNYLQSPKPQAGFIKNGSTFFNDWKAWVNPTHQMMINNAKNGNSMLYMPNPYESKGEEK